MKCSTIRVICTCDQCDSAFCALQLTALIKPSWCKISPMTILLCLFASKYDINGSRLNYSTVCSSKFNYITGKSSAMTKLSVISFALKTHLEIRLGICIYKTWLLHRPVDYIGFTLSCPPTFHNKFALMYLRIACTGFSTNSHELQIESKKFNTKFQLQWYCVSETYFQQDWCCDGK